MNAVHQDVRFTRAMTAAVNAEIDALATWLASTTSASSVSASPHTKTASTTVKNLEGV